jgi:hypothetical protein
MPREISPVAKSILVLLNNAEELVRHSSNRKDAKEVIRAARIYAQSKNFPMPEEEIEDFNDILLDAKPNRISAKIREIASKVINSEFSFKKK